MFLTLNFLSCLPQPKIDFKITYNLLSVFWLLRRPGLFPTQRTPCRHGRWQTLAGSQTVCTSLCAFQKHISTDSVTQLPQDLQSKQAYFPFHYVNYSPEAKQNRISSLEWPPWRLSGVLMFTYRSSDEMTLQDQSHVSPEPRLGPHPVLGPTRTPHRSVPSIPRGHGQVCCVFKQIHCQIMLLIPTLLHNKKRR